MELREFEVFKGIPESKAFRLGAVCGSQRAVELMYRMYARLPGDYFVRDASTQRVVASLRARSESSSTTAGSNFDIFRGLPEQEAVCIETAEALSHARQRMEQMARLDPASYFVFSRFDRSILTFAGRSER